MAAATHPGKQPLRARALLAAAALVIALPASTMGAQGHPHPATSFVSVIAPDGQAIPLINAGDVFKGVTFDGIPDGIGIVPVSNGKQQVDLYVTMEQSHVPFSGWVEGSPALLGGHIEGIVAQPGEVKPLVDGKKLRVLLVFQRARHPIFPDAPTAKELGYDFALGVWFVLTAPKGTPAPTLKYLHDAAKAAMDDPGFVKLIADRGVDIDYRAGAALRQDLWREYREHGEILKRLGMVTK